MRQLAHRSKIKLVNVAMWTLALGAGFAATRPAEAFCGFYVAPSDKPLYNDATMVALMRDGTRTVISMSNNYKGPAAEFAMVVPVPVVLQKADVKTLPKDVFTHLEQLSAPRLVEYWEQDPCYVPRAYPAAMPMGGAGGAPMTRAAPMKAADYGVTIEAKFAVGEYDILILGAKESDGLERWLTDNKYNIPKGASAALAPYIREGQKFFVAKIDPKKIHVDAQGVAQLSPLRFAYESPDFRLPVRLGLLNAHGKQNLIVYTLSRTTRFDVANYPNAYIPTNLEVKDDTRKSFGPFYAALFDEAVNAGQGKAIVTEYAWQTTSCDPCPTPPLAPSDITTLGGDVLFGMAAPTPTPMPVLPLGSAPLSRPMPPRPGGPGGGYFGPTSGMILTRLHARYDATTLTEDLVFRAAPPIVGGREFVVGDKGQLERGAQPSGGNNFQARYVIRHAWKGPIACASPVRGQWGGPWAGVTGPTGPLPAVGLSSVVRGSVKLSSMLKDTLPAIELVPASTLPIAAPSASVAPIDPIAPPDSSASAAPMASDSATGAAGSPGTVPSVTPAEGHGCGCTIPSAGESTSGLLGMVGVAGLVAARARRRR